MRVYEVKGKLYRNIYKILFCMLCRIKERSQCEWQKSHFAKDETKEKHVFGSSSERENGAAAAAAAKDEGEDGARTFWVLRLNTMAEATLAGNSRMNDVRLYMEARRLVGVNFGFQREPLK